MAPSSKYTTIQRGSLNSDDYRLFFAEADGGKPVSPFHDIPLIANAEKKTMNMVVEIPRWTNAKMEIHLGEKLNPIKQDTKKGKLRYVANVFPHKGYIWNYGCLPQTWEDPAHVDASTGCKGDGDPIDVCEIGNRVHERGAVVEVKILGTVALIDEGETDWKVLAIDVDDPRADSINDIADIEKEMPGFLAATVEWFKIYKMPDGKPANQFAFGGEPKDREFAMKIVEETNGQWKKMIEAAEAPEGLERVRTVHDGALTAADEAKAMVEAAAACGNDAGAPSETVDKLSFVKL